MIFMVMSLNEISKGANVDGKKKRATATFIG
jgi:hypothetical protein